MSETVLNIYLIIENGYVTEFRANAYEVEGMMKTKLNI